MKKEIREKVHEKCLGSCGYCGDKIDYKAMQVDHIICQNEFVTHIKNQYRIPDFLKHLSETDVNHIDNLMPTCRFCNNWKGANSLDGFRKEMSEQLKRLNDYSANFRMAKRYNLLIEQPKDIIFHFESLNMHKPR